MSSTPEQIERVLEESGVPTDPTAEEPLEPDIHPDRTREMTHTGFSRMEMTWPEADRERLAIVEAVAEDIIEKQEFRVAFAIREKLRKMVRVPVVDRSTGVLQTNADGSPVWEEDEYGIPVERWELLDDETRSNAFHTVTVYMLEWEMLNVNKWARAIFSKVQWEEVFARGYTALPGVAISGKPTIQDRTEWGQRIAIESRYFAVFQSSLSKKADAVVRSMEKLRRLLEVTVRS